MKTELIDVISETIVNLEAIKRDLVDYPDEMDAQLRAIQLTRLDLELCALLSITFSLKINNFCSKLMNFHF